MAGSAQTTTVTRSLSAFDEIGISGGYDAVILKEGDSESVKLELSGIEPDNIITEVADRTLKIRTKRGNYRNFKATITVTYRSLKAIANSGSTDIEAQSVLKAENFELASSGSGDFRGAFEVRKLEIAISGSSDMELRGNAEQQEIAISGSGDIRAADLQGKSASVAISGSGDVELGVKGPIKTSISGSGRVTSQ
jgi:hypothetical protein